MTAQTLAAAHGSGYLDGIWTGISVGGVIGIMLGLLIAALLRVSSGEAPAPEPLVPGQRFARLMLGDEPRRKA